MRIHDTTVLGRYQASHLATGLPIALPQVQVQLAAFVSTISLLNDHDLCIGQSSRCQYLLSIAGLNDAIIARIYNTGIARYVYYFKTKKSGNQYIHIREVTNMYEVFPGSISPEENWTDSVHNHDNEHVLVLVMSMHFSNFYLINIQCLINQGSIATLTSWFVGRKIN